MNLRLKITGLLIVLAIHLHSAQAQEEGGIPEQNSSPATSGWTLSSGWGGDSLRMAISINDSAMALEQLKKGYKPVSNPDFYFSPLIRAVILNRVSIVKMMLDYGFNVNDTLSFDKTTALHEAVKNEFGPMADMLLLRGANTEIRDYKGSTPLMYAAGYGNAELTDMLLYYGANPDPKDLSGNNALMIATMAGSTGVVDLLLSAGANPDTADFEGFTPLMVASAFGDTATIVILLATGASLIPTNKFGCDALCVALRNKQYGIVPLLVEAGANVNVPLGLAQKPRDLVPYRTPLDSLFKSRGAKKSYLPQFNTISFGYMASFNQRDFINGLSVGFIDQHYKSAFILGYATRFWNVKVIESDTGNLSWQFRERRSLISADFLRDFMIHGSNNKSWGGFLDAGLAFSWGSYKGSDHGPLARYFFVPGLGLTHKSENWILRAGYSFMDLKINDFPRGRLTVGLQYNFSIISKKSFTKSL